MAKLPRWTSPARQGYLIKLFSLYGNQCLLGHTACPIPEHYIHTEQKAVLVPTSKLLPCKDKDGNALRDAKGNQLYLTVYPISKAILNTKSISRLYELKSENVIKDWIADDRAQSQADYQAEFEARHKTNDRSMPLHGKFSGIGKDVYYDNQPQYFVENVGISGLTYKPFAKLRIASSYIRLFVDLGERFKPVSKSQKRKAIRYGKIPKDTMDKIELACWKAVKHYLS